MDYDFRSLSPYEFEKLVRDLLQRRLGLQLEAFAPGPDSGIDLRHISADGVVLVIQCKHFANTDFAGMVRQLKREEVPKVHTLAPHRYGLATSMPLTPKRKDNIVDLFRPYIPSPSYVWGRSDLNALLRDYEQVAEKHPKLWLTSAYTLRRLIAADVANRSSDLLWAIEQKAKRYVYTRSYADARRLLEAAHVCVITGEPGIGKTTLAEMLVADYVSSGFDVVVASRDIADAERLYQPEIPQIFYYNDFLGQNAAFEAQGKNEDSRLVQFMSRIQRAENKRFLMTTREYLLRDARQRSEILDYSSIDVVKCTVSLQSYSRLQRGEILYNHLYFSDLSDAAKLSICSDGIYRRIVDHANFSPRLIEHAVGSCRRDGLDGPEFSSHLLRTLDDPTRVWQHAFREFLSPIERACLVTLASMPPEVRVWDLLAAAGRARPDLFGPSDVTALHAGLRRLDGTFVVTSRQGSEHFVRFHNPSIRDFTWKYLLSEPAELDQALLAIEFFEQARWFDEVLAPERRDPNGTMGWTTDQGRTLLDAMMRTFWARGVAWSHTSVLGSAAARVKLAVNFEDRLATVLTQMVRVRAEYGDWLASTLQRLEERWRIGLFDRAGLLRLSVTYRRLRGPWHTAMQRADDLIERCLVSNLQTGGDFEIALTYIETRHPGSERSFFDDPLKQDLTRRFKRFLSDSLRELSGSNATDVAGVIGELGRVAALFEVRDRRLAQIEARLGRFEANAGEVPALPPPPPDEQTDAANAERDLDRLFHYLVQPIGEGADAMRRATATRSRLSHEVGQN